MIHKPFMKSMFAAYLLMLLLVSVCIPSCKSRTAQSSLHVAAFGAVPDDGICDMEAIHNAIQYAIGNHIQEVHFDAGTYNMKDTVSVDGYGGCYIAIFEARDLTLTGKTDGQGRPATRLERNLVLNNETNATNQLRIERSDGITLRNFVLTNNPPLGSTARVVSVNADLDEVVVEVLEGLPAYDGMRCASAHAWDLETGKLIRRGVTPSDGTLSIGVDHDRLPHWTAIPGTNERRLKITGAGFAAKVNTGDGISWHHAASATNQTQLMHNRDVVMENIIMPNLMNMGMIAAFNHNLTFRKFRYEPENGNLAVGGRDGFHFSNNSGYLIVEDCYFKGMRMDPLVIRRTYGIVREIREDGALRMSPAYEVPEGDAIRFWAGEEPDDLTVTRAKRVQSNTYDYYFDGKIPAGITAGTPALYLTYSLDEAIIRNSVFEDNWGSAIVNFEENVTVEDCVFDNNAYQVKYGPNQVSGGFVRNNVVRNNIFRNTSWVDITRAQAKPSVFSIHSLSGFFEDPMYNKNILFSGNLFLNPHGDDHASIVIRHATDITISDNQFEGFDGNGIVIDPKTTKRITIK